MAAIGASPTDDGTPGRPSNDVIRRDEGGSLAWVSVGSEGAAELFRSRIEDSVSRCGGPFLDAVAVDLARRWIVDRELCQISSPILLGTSERVVRIGPSGDVTEPTDGIVCIGDRAAIAAGAAKAMVAHTEFEPEHVAREALRIACEVNRFFPWVEVIA